MSSVSCGLPWPVCPFWWHHTLYKDSVGIYRSSRACSGVRRGRLFSPTVHTGKILVKSFETIECVAVWSMSNWYFSPCIIAGTVVVYRLHWQKVQILGNYQQFSNWKHCPTAILLLTGDSAKSLALCTACAAGDSGYGPLMYSSSRNAQAPDFLPKRAPTYLAVVSPTPGMPQPMLPVLVGQRDRFLNMPGNITLLGSCWERQRGRNNWIIGIIALKHGTEPLKVSSLL